MIPNATNVFTKFNPLRGIWNRRADAQREDKELIRTEFAMVHFAKKLNCSSR